MPFLRSSTRLLSLSLLISLVVLGCSKKDVRAIVKGKVVVNTTPVTSGRVIMMTADGRSAMATLTKDGEYEIEDAPVGDVTALVEAMNYQAMSKGLVNRMPAGKEQEMQSGKGKGAGSGNEKETAPPDPREGGPPGGTMAAPAFGKYVPVPARYSDPKQSPLKFTIVRGTQTINLELKSP